MLIREAGLNDFESISKLENQIFNLHYLVRSDMIQFKKETFDMEAYTQLIGDSNSKIFVAIEEEQIIGHCITRKGGYKNHNMFKDMIILEIGDLCVNENYRNQGIGKMLFNKAKE